MRASTRTTFIRCLKDLRRQGDSQRSIFVFWATLQLMFSLALLVVCLAPFSSQAAVYANSDFGGTWTIQGQELGTTYAQSEMGYGYIVFTSTGAVYSGTYSGVSGGTRSITGGALSIDQEGRISGSIHSSTGAILTLSSGWMTPDKNYIIYIGKTQDGYVNIGWGMKRGSSHSTSDLNGVWQIYGEEFCSSWQDSGIGYGTLTINSQGILTGGSYSSLAGQTRYVTGGSLSLSSQGLLSGSISSSTGATLNISSGQFDRGYESSLMYIGITNGGCSNIGWGYKIGTGFATADLAGTWSIFGQEFGSSFSESGVGFGSMTVSSSGAVTGGTYRDMDGVVRSITGGQMTIDSQGMLGGVVHSSTGATLTIASGKMAENKRQIVYTGSALGAYEIGWGIRSGASTYSLGEAVDNESLAWSTGGDKGWSGLQMPTAYYGGDAAQSGTISHGQTTYVQTSITGPGTLSFYWKVSSESSYDFLKFYIDGIEQPGSISGSVNWVQKNYELPPGSHTLKWSYVKDGSVSSGSDCGWIDRVVWNGNSSSVSTPWSLYLPVLLASMETNKPPLAGSCAPIQRMWYGFNGCNVEYGPFYSNVTEAQMRVYANAKDENGNCIYDGFTIHPDPEVGYGHLIRKYEYGCISPANESWPLYLRPKN